MKRNIKIILSLLLLQFLFTNLAFAQNIEIDTLKTIETTGVFEGELVHTGNFRSVMVYKINEYCKR